MSPPSWSASRQALDAKATQTVSKHSKQMASADRLDRRVDADIAAPPRPVAPSNWMLPDPHITDIDGVVGIGGDLAPETLVDAYRRGIFPWPHDDVHLPWFSPDPRGVVRVDAVHVSRSLRRRLRQSTWVTTVDAAFNAVVAKCASGRDEGTWITTDMAAAYHQLHELGWAHSLEVWEADTLVGGVYGVQVGGVFTGESMFHRRTDASKAAVVDLCARLRAAGGTLLDAQLATSHLASLGVTEMPRPHFLHTLAQVRDDDVRLSLRTRPVARLVNDA